MILPMPEVEIRCGETFEWSVQSQLRGIPKRLLIEQSVTPYISIQDIRIGNTCYTAAWGVIPADAFAIDGSLLDKALKSDGRINFEEDLKLELPIVEVNRIITVIVTNVGPSIMRLRGAWELITESDDDPRMVLAQDRLCHMIASSETVAVAADGTMWKLGFRDGSFAWSPLPPLPMTTKAALKSQVE